MEEAGEGSTYLGLPNMMKKSKSATLGFLKGKVKNRLFNWDGRWFSQGGREILVKSVAQCLPNYAMSCFLLPTEITRDIEQSIARFWWGAGTSEKRRIHWMSWDRLSKHKSTGGMGFRNFKDFNLALLGKQSWRLLSNPQSLVSRVYKARYFPKSNFLEAKMGNNPSFIWRSLMAAKGVVADGARWQVGTGERIEVLNQPWLTDVNPYINSESPSLVNCKVISLMAEDQRGWDEEILRDLFNDRDQRCIKKVKIGEYGVEDRVYWAQEVHGNYSVRSAYRLLQRQKGYWEESDNNSVWRKVWQIKAPAKILNLIWRSLSFCLPTLTMLRQKGVGVETVCPVCKLEAETIDHVFLRCTLAIQCWLIVLPGMQYVGQNLYQWWEQVLNKSDSRKRAEVAAVCWSIWKARNEVVWNNKYTRVYVVLACAKKFLDQWRIAQKSAVCTSRPHLLEGDGSCVWVKPQESKIKVSVDASTFDEFDASGIGMAARDASGSLLAARTVRVDCLKAVEMIEAMAIKEALSWIKNQGWRDVIIESDSLIVVQAIRSKVRMSSPFGTIISECRSLLVELNTVSVSFIRRSANMVAHELARAAYSFPDRLFDRSSVPIEVAKALDTDLY